MNKTSVKPNAGLLASITGRNDQPQMQPSPFQYNGAADILPEIPAAIARLTNNRQQLNESIHCLLKRIQPALKPDMPEPLPGITPLKEDSIGSNIARSINDESLVLADMTRDVEDALARLAL